MAIAASLSIETRRLEEQTRLDALKTAAERNKWGQFATPPELAVSIARYSRGLLGDVPVRFLDPAVGTGSFYSALRQAYLPKNIESATGVELDTAFAEAAENLWSGSGLNVIRGDFTKQLPLPRYNLVLTNPPYVRHQHLRAEEKQRLKGRLAESLFAEISGLAGLYCYFLLLAHDWMEEGALAAWLIPSEFMDVNYGSALRKYLTESVTLLHIHRFCPTDVQFTDALVSSAIVVFRKARPRAGHHARFSFAGPIEYPQTQADIPLDVLRYCRKWTQFPARTSTSSSGELKLGDIFDIKRGLATGSNAFFILNKRQAEEWSIPREFLKPILPGPRYIQGDIIEANPDGSPAVSPQLYLLDCSEPEERIKTRWPRFYAYLQKGEKEEIAGPIWPATAHRGTRKNNGARHHSFAPTWDGPAAANTLSALSGTVRRRRRTTSTSCSTREARCWPPCRSSRSLRSACLMRCGISRQRSLLQKAESTAGGFIRWSRRSLPRYRPAL